MALLFLLPTMVEGQKIQLKDRGPWEISAFAGGFDDDFEFDPDGSNHFIDPDQNVLFGLRFNYHLPFNIGPFGTSLGLDGRFVPLDIVPQATRPAVTDMNTYFLSPVFGISLPLISWFDIYGVVGVSGVNWRPEVGDTEIDFGYTYGGGAHLYMKENVALFGDFRMFQVPSAMEDVALEVTGYTANETFWGYSISGGISYFFGTKDTDKDGVKDPDDECPDTPLGVEVDERGCPLDDDGDGVPNYMDDCPDTPAGAPVDAAGCPLDSDNDGVPDYMDNCPNTPAGAPVDAQGCPLDSDGDGVPDYMDRCPNTPRGTEVDAQGCPLPPPPPPPVRSYTFEDIFFDFDQATIKPEGEAKLRAIGDTLVSIMNPVIEVHGHTDSTGPEEYNLGLSNRRAVAVRDFLLENFSQLRQAQFTIRDFGETEPIDTNDTREGRANNRRVEIKIIPSGEGNLRLEVQILPSGEW
jgi:outer membrane protein OmpA-like peptidoglycan-associated protein/opacity protein-like surface antigen